jgi:hypothetical protein
VTDLDGALVSNETIPIWPLQTPALVPELPVASLDQSDRGRRHEAARSVRDLPIPVARRVLPDGEKEMAMSK